MTGLGNEAQVRVIADQVAEAAIVRFYQTQAQVPQQTESIVPAPLKWAAGIVGALFTAATIGMAFWMVTTLSGLQETVTRIDERQKLLDPALSKRFDDVERRLGVLETDQRERRP